MDLIQLYIDFVNAGLLKHDGNGGKLPKYYTERKEKELRPAHEPALQAAIDQEIDRITQASDSEVLGKDDFSDDPKILQTRLQLLMDGFKYRETDQNRMEEAQQTTKSKRYLC